MKSLARSMLAMTLVASMLSLQLQPVAHATEATAERQLLEELVTIGQANPKSAQEKSELRSHAEKLIADYRASAGLNATEQLFAAAREMRLLTPATEEQAVKIANSGAAGSMSIKDLKATIAALRMPTGAQFDSATACRIKTGAVIVFVGAWIVGVTSFNNPSIHQIAPDIAIGAAIVGMIAQAAGHGC